MSIQEMAQEVTSVQEQKMAEDFLTEEQIKRVSVRKKIRIHVLQLAIAVGLIDDGGVVVITKNDAFARNDDFTAGTFVLRIQQIGRAHV